MKSSHTWYSAVVVAALIGIFSASTATATDLLSKKCSELVKSAQTFQDDLKTVDMVLGSAISAGTMARIKKYKLRKAQIGKHLSSVMKAIEVKGCVKSK